MSKQIVLAGFHAVNSRARTKPETIKIVYVDPTRRDKRMQQCRAHLQLAGVKVANADPRRLDGMAPDLPHQGIVALADEIENSLSFDELLDQITPETLLLVLDGVTGCHEFRSLSSCGRRSGGAGCHCSKGSVSLIFACSSQSSGRGLGDGSGRHRDQSCSINCRAS